MQNLLIIILAILIFGILIYSLVVGCSPVKEGWTNYQELPFGNVWSGSGSKGIRPIDFYNSPVYRRPLNWPVCHLVDYPVPHCRSDSF
jgi:hypothetical protein